MSAKKASGTVTGYCFKCKKTVPITDAKEITMKNGRKAIKGTCGKCGTKMFKIGGLQS